MADTTLGQRIAAKRKDLGLSQSSLGEQLGVSRQSIFKWESDAAIPEIDKLIALSRLFGVSVGWLLGIESDPTPKTEAPDFTEREKRLLEQFATPSPAPSPWQKIVTIAAAVCAAASLILSGVALYRANQSNDRAGQFQKNLEQIQALSGEINGLLGLAESELISSFTCRCTPNLEMTQAEVSLDIVPTVYQEENKCTLRILMDGETLASYDCGWNNSSYHVDFSLDAANGYLILFCVEDAQGNLRTESLEGTPLRNLAYNMAWPETASVTWKSEVASDDCIAFRDMTVEIPLPGIFRNQEGVWEKCDLVLTTGDGYELDRIDLLHRSSYSEKLDFSSGSVSFITSNQSLSFPALADGQRLYLNLECALTTGHSFQYPVGTWQKTGETLMNIG